MIEAIVNYITSGIYTVAACIALAGAVFALVSFDGSLITKPLKWPCVIICVAISAGSFGFVTGINDPAAEIRKLKQDIAGLNASIASRDEIARKANLASRKRQRDLDSLNGIVSAYEQELNNDPKKSERKCSPDAAYNKRMRDISKSIPTASSTD